MSTFNEGRQFAVFMTSVVGGVFAPAALLKGDLPVFLFAVGCLAYASTALVMSRTAPHGRGRTLRSRVRRGLAWLTVAPPKPCGCFETTDSDTVETESFVRRSEVDALVRFEARKRRLRRCHGCGRHYHDETRGQFRDMGNHRPLKRLTQNQYRGHISQADVWPEDEPDAREAIDAPIERAE